VADSGRSDSGKVKLNPANFRCDEGVHETPAVIQPREKLVLDFVMHRQSCLRAVRPDFGEPHQSHDVDVPAYGFECTFVGRVALHRKAIATPNEPIARVEQFVIVAQGTDELQHDAVFRQQTHRVSQEYVAIDRDERAVVRRNLIEADAEKHVDDHLLRRRLRTRGALADALQQQLIAVELLRTIEDGLSPNEDLHSSEYRLVRRTAAPALPPTRT
jgi:hypothetical protein